MTTSTVPRRRGLRRQVALAIAVTATTVLVDIPAAMAQIVESDIDAEPGTTETTQLVTSSTEVRRAVIGLLAVAALAGVLFIIYWYMTGQQARERYARQFGGRHAARSPQHGARRLPSDASRQRPVAVDPRAHPGAAPQPHAPYPYPPQRHAPPMQPRPAPRPQMRPQPQAQPAGQPSALYPTPPPAPYPQAQAQNGGLYPSPPTQRQQR